MLQVEYRKEGMQNYLVLPCEKNITEGYESMLMQYHVVPYMIPYEIREVNGICELYNRLQYRTTLKAVIGHLPLNMPRLFHMLESIVGVLETAEEYLFDEESILWDSEYIFIEADTGRLQFCSYPDYRNSHCSLKKLLTELIQRADKRDDAAVMYLLQFYNLVTEPDCSLAVLKNFMMRYSEKMVEEQESQIHEEEIKENVLEDVIYPIERKNPGGDKKEKRKEKADENSRDRDEQMGEKIVKWMLVVTALFNLGLIAMLLFNVLTYDYVKYLLGSMGAMIVLTIIYMNISKEETPDEMMQAFFEENTIPPADWVLSRLAYAGVSDRIPISGKPKENGIVENKENHMSNPQFTRNMLQQYGETTVLNAGDKSRDINKEIVEEEYDATLFLASFVLGKYKPIFVENSIIVGCMEEGCNYLLKQRGISRMHAKLMKKTDGLYLLDLNSTYGTFLNGEAIVSGEEYKLDEGDVVAFAQWEFYVTRIIL